MNGPQVSFADTPILLASLSQYMAWCLLGLLILTVVAVTFIWRSRKRWPFLSTMAKHPFAKYVALSLVVHFVLMIWLLSSSLFSAPAEPQPPAVVVRLGPESGPQTETQAEPNPWDQPSTDAVSPPEPQLVTPTHQLEEPIERPPSVDSPPIDSLPDSSERVVAPITQTAPPERSFTDTSAPAVPIQTGNDSARQAENTLDASFTNQPAQQPTLRDSFSQESVQHSPLPAEQPDTASLAADTAPDLSTFESEQAEWPKPSFTHEPEPNLVSSDPPTELTVRPRPELPSIPREPTKRVGRRAINRFDQERRVTPISVSATTSQTMPRIKNPEVANPDAVNPEVTHPRMRADLPSQPQLRESPRANSRSQSVESIPAIYHDRFSDSRLAIARRRGGSINTERAVQAALVWLVSHQSDDGRWDASEFGSGRPTFEGGHDRRGAGRNADMGTTGLALLAFLGAGHTHQHGEYSTIVQSGLDFLIQSQRKDGNLAGDAQLFAAMYCHGIAFLALSEAYSLTGDETLLPNVNAALRYTLDMQHPATGGWRYRRGGEGDTSQLGWQLMALTSAHYAGLEIPGATWSRAGRFLRSVTSRDGRASYRPRQLPSSAMTAEAMLCRLFLGTSPQDSQIQSAARYVAYDLPGMGRLNYYYWYYGTLALYHLQDENWYRWNAAVKKQLVGRQQGDGSWTADSVWGTSGGKVYSTALGALTLEVYYRYRPLQSHTREWNPRTSPIGAYCKKGQVIRGRGIGGVDRCLAR